MLRLKAFAKINLSLKILGIRPDGYHSLESVMQSVSLHDVITLEPTSAGIQLATNNLKLPVNHKNLAYQAAEIFMSSEHGAPLDRARGKRNMEHRGVKIYIEKNIPLASGLAGGSADAAAVLYGLNELMPPALRVTRYALQELGAKIGSDVPFCLMGGNCTVKGRGEVVVRNPMNISRLYVLVIPDVEVSTKWAYEAWDRMTNDQLKMTNEGNNYLEPVVIAKYPVIGEVKRKLLELGCTSAQMSGSGSSVFGQVKDLVAGERIAAAMKREYPHSFAISTVDRGVL